MTCPTDHSLPGIGCALMITTSSSVMRSHLFCPVAMSESADIGSPCEPVEITHTSPGGTLSTASMSINTPSGMLMMPRRVPSSTFLPMERPSVATLRPFATAASMICCTRCMWLAKQATTMRLPDWDAKTRRNTTPTEDSDSVNPGSSALVESDKRRRIPSVLASSPMRDMSVRRPSTGCRSILKSPECRITPWGVWNAMAIASGTECVTGMNSTSQGPMRTRSPSATETNFVLPARPASSTRWRARPTVSSEP